MKLAGLLAAFFLVCAVQAMSQEAPSTVTTLNADAIQAYQVKDYKQFLEDERQALKLDPANPRILYNVACGEALQGNAHQAVKALDELLDRKLDLGAEKDGDFAAIRKSREWSEFESRLAELRKPLVRSEVAFKLPDPNLVATGIAVDPTTGDTYVASLRERKIVCRTKGGAVSDFIHQAQDGFLAGDSLLIDASRRVLYATTSAVPYMLEYHPEDQGKSGVYEFDLKTGKLLRNVFLPADGKRHILNAMTVDRAGNLYVSDTGASGIYVLQPGSASLTTFVPSNVFRATQGMAFSSDEKTLYVADYTNGLWALDMATKEPRHLEAPADVWLFGLDGLSRANDGLISVQIGVQPQRVLYLHLDPRRERVSKVDILEMSHPDYAGPIQGTVAGNAFFYVANSQLTSGDAKTGAFAADAAKPTVVLRLPL